MRHAALLAIGLLLILVQGNLFRILGPLGIHGAAPSLVLPIVVFLGVHETSLARGALLTAVLGYALDILGSAPLGLFTFVFVALFVVARVAGVRLTTQTVLTQITWALAFTLAEGGIVLVLLAVFGSDPQRPVELASVVLPHAVATALCAPVIFRLALRLYRDALTVSRAGEA